MGCLGGKGGVSQGWRVGRIRGRREVVPLESIVVASQPYPSTRRTCRANTKIFTWAFIIPLSFSVWKLCRELGGFFFSLSLSNERTLPFFLSPSLFLFLIDRARRDKDENGRMELRKELKRGRKEKGKEGKERKYKKKSNRSDGFKLRK